MADLNVGGIAQQPVVQPQPKAEDKKAPEQNAAAAPQAPVEQPKAEAAPEVAKTDAPQAPVDPNAAPAPVAPGAIASATPKETEGKKLNLYA